MAGAVQYIVVRRDIDMSRGKMAAQVAHASLGAVLPHFRGANRYVSHHERFADFAADIEEWLDGAFTKVVLAVDDRTALERVVARLDERRIPHEVVRDICRTELAPEDSDGTTPTCVGVCPLRRESVPGFLRGLPLWRD